MFHLFLERLGHWNGRLGVKNTGALGLRKDYRCLVSSGPYGPCTSSPTNLGYPGMDLRGNLWAAREPSVPPNNPEPQNWGFLERSRCSQRRIIQEDQGAGNQGVKALPWECSQERDGAPSHADPRSVENQLVPPPQVIDVMDCLHQCLAV